MEKRPLLSRFTRFWAFVRLAVNEAHAVLLAVIGGVLFLLASTFGPWFLARYYPVLAFRQPNLLELGCGVIIIILALLFVGGYLTWEEEQRQYVALKERLKPNLRIDFDPRDVKFLTPTRHGHVQTLYVRVNAKALSPTVRNCRGFLERVSQIQGSDYVTLFEESIPLPWSYDDPNAITPKDLKHGVDALLDVAYFTDQSSGFPAFSFLNVLSRLPERLLGIQRSSILPNPHLNLKLDLVITGDDCENAYLSLNIHLGQRPWDQPQVGWMKGKEIRRDPTWSTDI
jgi:hypothetical protein